MECTGARKTNGTENTREVIQWGKRPREAQHQKPHISKTKRRTNNLTGRVKSSGQNLREGKKRKASLGGFVGDPLKERTGPQNAKTKDEPAERKFVFPEGKEGD